ncbi:MAG TPA: DUF790 family protein [Planctomycetaceae bacterium]|nr:DUF790 family protein [Planctomycetaceae bacterium]
MLTRDLAIAEYDFATGTVRPDRLTTGRHRHYAALADRMLAVYRTGIGRTRNELHRDVHGLFASEPECPQRRIDAFCKLLDETGVFSRDKAGRAAALRREVFQRAARLHPLVSRADRLFEHTEAAARLAIAGEIGRSWGEIESELFADVIDFQRLEQFHGYPDGRALLSRYNVAQIQAALYDAVSMTVWAGRDFKTVLRQAKLAGLMHDVRRQADGRYVMRFSGPASVLRETRRYGTAMARFLPSLLACRDWRMHAILETRRRGWTLSLDLSPADGLTSHLSAPLEFDSTVEEAFARKWGSAPRDGWTLIREGDVLTVGQKVFVPDFTLQHEDGRRILLEIVGFWTADYLEQKVATLRLFADRPILLAVAASVSQKLPAPPPGAIIYKTALRIKDVLARLQETPPPP